MDAKGRKKTKKATDKAQRPSFALALLPVRNGRLTPKQAEKCLESAVPALHKLLRDCGIALHEGRDDRWAIFQLSEDLETLVNACQRAIRSGEPVALRRSKAGDTLSGRAAEAVRLLGYFLTELATEAGGRGPEHDAGCLLVEALLETLEALGRIEREHERKTREPLPPTPCELRERYIELCEQVNEGRRQQEERVEKLSVDFYALVSPLLEHEHPVEALEKERDEIKAKVWPEESEEAQA